MEIRIYVIGFHIALLIWIGLTYTQGDNAEHWTQTILIFLNMMFIAFHIERIWSNDKGKKKR